MSWNGTVYCRYCGQKGHNSRTCPEKTEHLKRRAEQEGEGREGYWHRQYAKRAGVWLDGSSAKELKKTGNKRRCKYCQKTGHNTRTCPELAEAKKNYIGGTQNARAAVKKAFGQLGLGVGALVRTEQYGEPVLWMVEKINLEQINHEHLEAGHGYNLIQLKRLSGASNASHWQQTHSVGMPALPAEILMEHNLQQNNHGYFQLVGPVAHGLEHGMSEAWLAGEDVNLNDVFEGRQSPNAYENRWE